MKTLIQPDCRSPWQRRALIDVGRLEISRAVEFVPRLLSSRNELQMATGPMGRRRPSVVKRFDAATRSMAICLGLLKYQEGNRARNDSRNDDLLKSIYSVM